MSSLSNYRRLLAEQEVWLPGSADTICPRPLLMTQVQHFVSGMKKRQRCDVQTMWACDLDFWPWNWCANVARVVDYSPTNVGDTTAIRCRCMGYWAWPRVSGRRETSSLSIDWLCSDCCCLNGGNWQITVFGNVILDLESDFRKLGSIAMLRSLIRILHVSLVQIDTEVVEKYAKQQQPTVCGKFAFGRCVRLVTLTFWPWNCYASRI